MAKLILSMDGLVLKEIVLKKERLSIGRKPHNDVQIDNLAVSGEHARIVTILDDSFLEDMDSTNGTLVNGRPVKKHRLKHNDVIELGKYKLKYLNDPEEEGNEGSFDPGISVQSPVQAPVPVAKIHVLTGKNAGRMLSLVKPVTSLGRPGVQVALINGGGLRAPLRQGALNYGDMLAVLPFGNKVIIRDFTGEQLLLALEHGVSDHKGVGAPVLHTAGLRYVYNPALPSGKRIVHAELLGEGNTAKALVPTARYRVALVDYLERRGDGYAMLAKGTPVDAPDPVDADVLSAYIKKYSPLNILPPDRLIKQTK